MVFFRQNQLYTQNTRLNQTFIKNSRKAIKFIIKSALKPPNGRSELCSFS